MGGASRETLKPEEEEEEDEDDTILGLHGDPRRGDHKSEGEGDRGGGSARKADPKLQAPEPGLRSHHRRGHREEEAEDRSLVRDPQDQRRHQNGYQPRRESDHRHHQGLQV